MIRFGLGCPLHCGQMHFGRIVNPFGWAMYVGPFYVLRVTR